MQNRTRLKQMKAVGVEFVGILPVKIEGRVCPFVLELENKDFTPDTVPHLPLPECKAKCGCIYYAKASKVSEADKAKATEKLKSLGFSIKITPGNKPNP